MKFLSVALASLLLACQSKQSQTDSKNDTEDSKKLKVLLVGTFHFENFTPSNNSDVAQTNEVDVLSNQNQEELEIISDKIAAFNPDKIFVEVPYEAQSKLDTMYQSFTNQDLRNSVRNETIQLGCRVAKKLNHDKLYAYDYRGSSFPYSEMLETMKNAEQVALIEKDAADMAEYEYRYNQIVRSSQSVTEVLYFLNDEKNRTEDLGWYLNIANTAGTKNDTIGTFLTSEWYRRNLQMYATIQKQIAKDDQKIMILSGASHISMFKNFMAYNPEWQTVELKELMKY